MLFHFTSNVLGEPFGDLGDFRKSKRSKNSRSSFSARKSVA
jgi:hypothetical protein